MNKKEEMPVARVQMCCVIKAYFKEDDHRKEKRPNLLFQVRILDQNDCCICGHTRGINAERWSALYLWNSWGKGRLWCIFGYINDDMKFVNWPILLGKTVSSSSIFCAQFIKASTYSGAGSFVGRRNFAPSSQRYSYLCKYAYSVTSLIYAVKWYEPRASRHHWTLSQQRNTPRLEWKRDHALGD